MTGPDPPPPAAPLEGRSNAGIGILRFFLWLMPAGITVGTIVLGAWLESFRHGMGTLATPIGIGLALLCAWFDSGLTPHCRSGRRSVWVHMLLFMLIEGFLIVPAVIFATLYAICAAIS